MAGATLRSIMEQAYELALAPRALRVEMSALHKVKLPAILHWDLNHFVVLKSVSKKRIVVHDPALGRREFDWKQFSDHFTGVVLELTPAKSFTRIEARAPTRIRDLWSSSEGFWGSFAHVLVLTVALQIVVFAAPFQLQLVIEEAIFRSDRDLLTVLALGFGALVVVQAVIEALRGWTLSAIGHMLSFQLVANLVRHLLRLPASYFEKRHVGDSYDNALAETIIGLYKTEVVEPRGPWKSYDSVEYAVAEWVAWFNTKRLLGPIGDIPPAEAEDAYWKSLEEPALGV